MSQRNEGIQISGGTFHAGQVVVGRGGVGFQLSGSAAQALHDSGKDELAAAIESFLKAMKAHAEKLDSLDEVVQAVQQVAEESGKEKPNRVTLSGILASIKEVVCSVAAMTPAFTVLHGAVMAVLGGPRP